MPASHQSMAAENAGSASVSFWRFRQAKQPEVDERLHFDRSALQRWPHAYMVKFIAARKQWLAGAPACSIAKASLVLERHRCPRDSPDPQVRKPIEFTRHASESGTDGNSMLDILHHASGRMNLRGHPQGSTPASNIPRVEMTHSSSSCRTAGGDSIPSEEMPPDDRDMQLNLSVVGLFDGDSSERTSRLNADNTSLAVRSEHQSRPRRHPSLVVSPMRWKSIRQDQRVPGGAIFATADDLMSRHLATKIIRLF
jgi:hypothetical protein